MHEMSAAGGVVHALARRRRQAEFLELGDAGASRLANPLGPLSRVGVPRNKITVGIDSQPILPNALKKNGVQSWPIPRR
jgi:hypothetical protein